MTESEAAKIVAAIGVAFPDFWRFLDEEQAKRTRTAYRTMLLDLPYEVADAASRRLLATCKKMPAIAEIRATCAALMVGRETSGGEAWGVAVKLAKKHGRRRSPGVDFAVEDSIIARCIDAMGWGDLCEAEPNDPAIRSQFVRLYDELAAQQREDLTVGAIAPPIPKRRLGAGPAPIAAILDGYTNQKRLKP